jgi:hypothetical protein
MSLDGEHQAFDCSHQSLDCDHQTIGSPNPTRRARRVTVGTKPRWGVPNALLSMIDK